MLAPFWDKAYTIDDATFITAADHVRAHPLHPGNFVVQQDGATVHLSWLRYLTTAYLLWPAAALDNAEWAGHAVMLLLFFVAVVATAALALRLGLGEKEARVAALLVATAPAALVMASTVMPDIPALSLGVLAVERTLAWRSERRLSQALAAALLLVAATLARSHAGLLLGVCALALSDAPGDAGRFFPVVTAAALLVVLAAAAHLGTHAKALGVGWGLQPASNAIALGVHQVLTVPLAIAFFLLRPRIVLGALYGVACAGSLLLLYFGGQPLQRYWALPLAALGFATVADLVRRSWRGGGVDRALGAWLLLPLPLILYDHLPSKYLAPVAPAVALLIARALPDDWRRRAIAWGMPALGALLSLVVIFADARFAGLARSMAATLTREQPRGKHLSVDGMWSFPYYVARAGGIGVGHLQRPGPGDRMLRSSYNTGELEHYERSRLVATWPGPTSWVHIMGHQAGFYSNNWGFWPFALYLDRIDQYEVWEILP
jgi:hypothetical protein